MPKLLTFLLFAGALAAGDLSGIWIGQIPPRNATSEPQEIAFKFSQDGAALTGKLYGDYQSTPIVEGKVTGDQVAFVVIAPEQAGNQINETKLRFTATVKDGEMEVTRVREGSKNAGNGGGVQFKGENKQVFQLKRLLSTSQH